MKTPGLWILGLQTTDLRFAAVDSAQSAEPASQLLRLQAFQWSKEVAQLSHLAATKSQMVSEKLAREGLLQRQI